MKLSKNLSRKTKLLVKKKSQDGNFLLITLCLLAAISIVVVGSLSRTPTREKLTALFYHKETAFRAAEAALTDARNFIENTAFVPEDFSDLPCTNAAQCFSAAGTNGLFKTITYANNQPCVHEEPSPPIWADESVWADPTRTISANTLGLPKNSLYIIEFLCYIPTNTAAAAPDAPPKGAYGSGWSYLFRVTTRATGADGQSVAILQTTYKKPI